MEILWRDIRYGLRTLTGNPGFALVAIIVLALGIGANTAIFSVVNGVLLQPLPYSNPDRLVMLWGTNTERPNGVNPVSYPDLLDWQAQNKSFESLAALFTNPNFDVNLTGGAEPERVPVVRVTPGYFETLGATPVAGRTFLPDEDEVGRHRVAMLSYNLWQRRFDSDPALVGKPVYVNGFPYEVVGVLPKDFRPLGSLALGEEVELWRPVAGRKDARYTRDNRFLRVVGRLKPGVTLKQAQTEMSTIAGRLAEEYPDTNQNHEVKLVSLHNQVVSDTRPALLILLGAVGLVLLIACANVANLLLARSAGRQKEMAIRAALGAGQGRLIRQLITESVLLSGVSGALGILLAYAGIQLVTVFSPGNIPRLEEITIDGWVLTFAFTVSLLTGVLFGLVPALQGSRPDLQEALKQGGRQSAGGTGYRLRNALVVTEVALALLLLVGAGLLMRSFGELLQVDPGFKPESVLTVQLELPMGRGMPYANQSERTAFYQQLLERLRVLPGVNSVGISTSVPLDSRGGRVALTLEGRPETEDKPLFAAMHLVDGGYFPVLGIPLQSGRLFNMHDQQDDFTRDTLRVVVINETMARQFWPGENPLGKKLRTGFGFPGEVVGVVADVKVQTLEEDTPPSIYWYAPQVPFNFFTVALRSDVQPMSLVPSVRQTVDDMDAELPLYNIRTMEHLISRSVAERRFILSLLSIFAGVALVLAAVGLYGVISFSVSQRTHEMGVRLALGARPADILKLVVNQGLLMTGIGIGVGLAGAFFLTSFLEKLLFRVTATDPLTFAGISLLLVVVAALACYVPARRATKVDPMVALRYE
jgi:putative ABC transport system permease protein